MRLLFLLLSLSLFFTASVSQGCTELFPQLGQIGELLLEKFDKDVCGHGVKFGGAQDFAWVEENIMPVIAALIGNALPDDSWKDIHKLARECHLDRYNYCNPADRIAVERCVQRHVLVVFPIRRVMKLMPVACPVVRNVLEGWPGRYEKVTLQLFSTYCETKGRTC